MRWFFHSKFGTMEIAPAPGGKYVLKHDDDEFGRAKDPQTIADNVYTHTCDWDEWDNSDEEGPTDLSQWDYSAR